MCIRDSFGIAEVAKGLSDKMVRRHPHVFDSDPAAVDGSTVENWDKLKQEEKQRESAMDGIPSGLPALASAQKVLSRGAKSAGSPDLGELGERLSDSFEQYLSNETAVGDLLLTVAELARQNGVDCELSLRQSVANAVDRFRSMERSGQPTAHWISG